jgi:hypothetical protein
MSPKRLVISTTYKTRVDPRKPCKELLGSAIGQLMDSRVFGCFSKSTPQSSPGTVPHNFTLKRTDLPFFVGPNTMCRSRALSSSPNTPGSVTARGTAEIENQCDSSFNTKKEGIRNDQPQAYNSRRYETRLR